MAEFQDKNLQKYLKTVAENAIAERLGLTIEKAEEPKGFEGLLKEKRGVFVTLEIDGKLRGCIGHIIGIMPLIEGIKENAVSAAFDDPRFEPLTHEEFEKISIEISILSVPKELKFDSPEDLKKKLRIGMDGVILSKGYAKATYLPQVWDTFKEEIRRSGTMTSGEISKDAFEEALKEEFLSSLCAKAGMDYDEWQAKGLKVETYEAEVF